MLLGVGATAAGVMLAGCGSDDESSDAGDTSSTTAGATSSTATSGGAPATPVGPAPLATELVTFPGPAGQLRGTWSAAPSPKGAVLIVHENRGLTPHFVKLPGRLAASGYSALAVDLVSRKGGTDSFPDEAQVQAALTGIPPADLVADSRAGLDELLRRVPGHKAGIMGFCFGGGMVWSVLIAGEDRLAAAVPFYGPLPDPHDFSKAKAAVLAFYGETDGDRVNGRDRAGQGGADGGQADPRGRRSNPAPATPSSTRPASGSTPRPRPTPTPCCSAGSASTCRDRSAGVSGGAVLTVAALALGRVILGLFRLVGVLDSAELTLRRLVAGVRAARKEVDAAGELATAVERDAARGQAALERLDDLKRGRPEA